MDAIMIYEILNPQGEVVNRISASPEYMQEHYSPEQYRVVPEGEKPALPRKITKGAFQNRLGPLNVFAIDNSDHPVCIALRSFINRLEYVDLGNPQTEQMLYMLVFANQPEANPAFPGSGPITGEIAEAVLMAPVQDNERP